MIILIYRGDAIRVTMKIQMIRKSLVAQRDLVLGRIVAADAPSQIANKMIGSPIA